MTDEALQAEDLQTQNDTAVDEAGMDSIIDEKNEKLEPSDLATDANKDDKTGDDKSPTPGESDSLQTKLEELESTNKGLIKSLSAQRSIRQDLQGQLDEIKDAIAEAKSSGLSNDTPADTADTVNLDNIPIEFDDDGNMFIKPEHIGSTNDSTIQSLQAEISQLKDAVTEQQIQDIENENFNAILNEKQGYKGAYEKVDAAWKYLKDDVFDDYLTKHNLAAPTTPDQAIDMIINSEELTSGFSKKYPSLNIESVLEANLIATPRYLRKALNNALESNDSSHETLDPSKPASLANANSGGSDTPESLLNRVADMSTEDYENLDARTIAKIDKLLEASG